MNETKNFKENAQEPTNQGDCVFLEESRRVVCLSCYSKHYNNQTSVAFGEKAACQSEECQSNNQLAIVAEYCAEKGETKEMCFYCAEKEKKQIKRILLKRQEMPCNCSKNPELHQNNLNAALFGRLFPNNRVKIPNYEIEDCISGYEIYLERRFSALSQCNLGKEPMTNKELKNTLLALTTLLISEIPFLKTSTDFLFLIRREKRDILLKNARNRLIYFIGNSKINNLYGFLLGLIRQKSNIEEVNLLCLFLEKEERLRILSILQDSTQIFQLSGLFLQLSLTEIMEMTPQDWEKTEETFKNSLQNIISEIIAFKKDSISKLEIYSNRIRIKEKSPLLEVEDSFTNEKELILLGNKLNFLVNQYIYSDISREKTIKQLKNALTQVKHELGVVGDKSNITPENKARLLYHTQFVSTVLSSLQILLETREQLVCPLNEDVLVVLEDLILICEELAVGCFDVSLLFHCNFHTLMKRRTNSTTIPLEKLLSSIFCFLYDSNIFFRETLIELQMNIGYMFYKSHLPRGASQKLEFDSELFCLHLFTKFYENTEDCSKIQEVFKNMEISFDFGIKCFILPVFEGNYAIKQQLLRNRLVFKGTKQFLTDSVITAVIRDERLDLEAKLTIISNYLTGSYRLTAGEVTLNTLNSFGTRLEKYLNSPLEFLLGRPMSSDLRLNFSYRVTSEKAKIWLKYSEMLRNYVKGNYSLISKLNAFSRANYLFKQQSEELSSYNLVNFDHIHFEIVNQIKNSPEVEFKEDNRNLTERLETFENKGKLIFCSEMEMKKYVSSLAESHFRGEKIVLDLNHNSNITEILRFRSELDLDKCMFKYISFVKGYKLGKMSFGLDLLLNSISKHQNYSLSAENMLDKLQFFARLFVYLFSTYNNALDSRISTEITEIYCNLVSKLIKFFRILVDSNTMELRELFTTEPVEIEVRLTVGDKFNVFDRKCSLNMLEILVKSALNLLKLFKTSLKDRLEPRIELFLSILDLISEITEGNSAASIDVPLYEFKEYLNDTANQPKNVLNALYDFYLKLYSEQKATTKHKKVILRALNTAKLVDKLKQISNIYFVSEILEDSTKNKVERLHNTYHSEDNTDIDVFEAVFSTFVYLRYKINYNFNLAENPSETLILVQFMEKITKRVELKINEESRDFFFLSSPDSKLLSEDSKNTFIKEVNRANTATKNEDMVNYAVHFKDEIDYVKTEFKGKWKKRAARLNLKWCILLCLSFTLGSAYLMLRFTDVQSKTLIGSTRDIFLVFMGIQSFLALVVLFIWFETKFYLKFTLTLMKRRIANNIIKGEETRRDRILSMFIAIYTSFEPISVFTILLTNILALAYDSLFWTVSLQLLCFVRMSRNLSNIVKAIQLRGKQLWLITLFLMGLLFIYSLLTFVYMSDSFQTEDGDMLCLTLAHCLASQFDFGFRMGGGMGDNMPVEEWQSSLFWRKFIYSMAHYILFPVIMLNVVAGVIIDTFADLREKTAELEEDKKTVCLICGGAEDQIKKEEGSFKAHLKEKHNVFDYMAFVKHILEEEEDKLDYFQTQVKYQIDNRLLNWIPINDEDINTRLDKLESSIKESDNNMNMKLMEISGNIGLLDKKMEEVSANLKKELEIALKSSENKLLRQFTALKGENQASKAVSSKNEEILNQDLLLILPGLEERLFWKEKCNFN